MLLDSALGNWKWYRRIRGGHWERWRLHHPEWQEVYCWVRAERCSRGADDPQPRGAISSPTCEDWTAQ